MAIVFVNHTALSGQSTTTSSAIDTTGANFLVFAVSFYGATVPSVSDNKGNTSNYQQLTVYGSPSYSTVLFYCASPTVGTGHTFTVTGTSIFFAAEVQAFSGIVAVSPFQAGTDSGAAQSSGTSIQPGSISPTGNSLIISSLGFDDDSACVH